MVEISVDGERLQVPEGRSILQALDELGLLMNGVDVPHYCWHPKLSVDGSCRMCQVEVSRPVDGELRADAKLQIACDTVVQPGMVVSTNSERVRKAREGVMELLLVNHPLDCPICDQAGECGLQDYAFEYGLTHARTKEPRRALKKRVDLGPTIVFDQERCILCRRCVRFCREVPGTAELVVRNRGDRSVIETFPGEPLANDYSMNVADICPVGALTTRDFRFKMRVWFLKNVPSVCTGCANGCNVDLGVSTGSGSKGEVQRITPRRNDAVNDTWICDEGRLSYKEIASPGRLVAPQLRDGRGPLRNTSLEDAISAAAARLREAVDSKGSGAVAALASPHATNEDLFVLRRLLDDLGVEDAGVAVWRGRSDARLLKAEKAANAAGARALGFGDPKPVLDRIAAGGVGALLLLGHDVLDPAWLGSEDALRCVDQVILLDTHHSALERVASVVIPTRHAAEKRGTLTNHAGRVQRVEPAVEPAHDAWYEGDVLMRLGRALGLQAFGANAAWDPARVSGALAEAVPAFRGCALDSLGPLGNVLSDAGGGE